MRSYSKFFLRTVSAVLVAGTCATPILSQQARKAAASNATTVRYRQSIHTNSGFVILGYGEGTSVTIFDANGSTVKSFNVGNQDVVQVPLKEGNYRIQANDDVIIVTSDLNAYNTKMTTAHFAGHFPPVNGKRGNKSAAAGLAPPHGARTNSLAGLAVLPVPWVADNTYASDPPSTASRHVVFSGVPTRLKVAVFGGTPPYTVAWNPGDGSAVQTSTAGISTPLYHSTTPNTFTLPVGSVDGLSAGDAITIDPGSVNQETNQVNYVIEEQNTNLAQNVDGGTSVIAVNYAFNYLPGDTVNLGQFQNYVLSGFQGNARTTTGTSPTNDQPAGTTTLIVNSLAGISVGDNLTLGAAGSQETVSVASIGSEVVSGNTYYTVMLSAATVNDHPDGDAVFDNNAIQSGDPETAVSGAQTSGTNVLNVGDGTAFSSGDSVTLYSTVENASETLTVALGGGGSGGTLTFTTPTTLDYNDGDAIYDDNDFNSGGTNAFLTANQTSSNSISVNTVRGISVGDNISLPSENATVASVGPGNTITFTTNTVSTYNAGDNAQDFSGVLVSSTPINIGFGNGSNVQDLNVQIQLLNPLTFSHSAGAVVTDQTGLRVGANGCVLPWTYTQSIGSLIHASVTITDSNSLTGTADYWIRVGDPSNQTDRVSRSTDEALWYLHTEMNRQDGVANFSSRITANEPAVNEGYIAQFETGGPPSYTYNGTSVSTGGVTIAPTAMFAIALENSGHSIEGGVNFSHQAAKDAYVDDLSRLVNYLTDTNTLTDVAPGYTPPIDDGGVVYPNVSFANKQYASGSVLNPVDTHWTGSGTPYVLVANTSRVIYEGGMQLQAIAQAGFTDEAVPNRSEYPSYYNLVGGFVDGFQYSQAVGVFAGNGDTFSSEGGWRYDFGYGDSDGSAVAWAAIGMNAAEHSYTLTPGGPPATGPYSSPILVDPVIRAELKIWLGIDQGTVADFANDFDPSGYNYNTGVSYLFNPFGGLGYTQAYYGPNAGKTGGGLEALAFAGEFDTGVALAATQQEELFATDYLWRNFYTNDLQMGWSSSRDAYGMYNMFKGLTGIGVTTLSQSATYPNETLSVLSVNPQNNGDGTTTSIVTFTTPTTYAHPRYVFVEDNNNAGVAFSVLVTQGAGSTTLTIYGFGTIQAGDSLTIGGIGRDLPGNTVTSIPWFSQFQDFIAGTGQNILDNNGNTYLDLGHQAWPGNSLNPSNTIHPSAGVGHYEPTGVRSWPVGPLRTEWTIGLSDWNADVNLSTAMEAAVLTGQVFTAGPVAVFGHPTGSETTVPETVNGNPFNVVFDPGGSTDLNPAGTIISVTWDFGDGSAPVSYNLGTPGPPGGAVPINVANNRTTHAYTVTPLPQTVTVSLTVFDNLGLSNTKTEQLTITNGVATPVARFTGASTDSRQSGNTIGIIDDGSANEGFVTIQYDGSASANPNPAGVIFPKNTNGISMFAWEWPTAPTHTVTADTSVNAGGSGTDFSFQEGALDMSGMLNSGSKAPIQTYTYFFGTNPANWPTFIQVSLKVQSNLSTPAGMPTDNNTATTVFNLVPSSSLATSLKIVNVSLHNITSTTALVSFDTVDNSGATVASTGQVNFGLTSGYGSNATDPSLRSHHDITLTGLTPGTTYHYQATAATGAPLSANTPDATFTTLFNGAHLVITQASVVNVGNNQVSVTWLVTNNGTLDAVNYKANGFGATLAHVATINGNAPPQTTAPVTLTAGGGSTTFTVVYTLNNPTELYFFGNWTQSYTYTGGTYSGSTGSMKVLVPGS